MSVSSHNEDTRVKLPAILTLTRLGYGYLSLKNATLKIDPETNIFTDVFHAALRRLNPDIEADALRNHFFKIKTCLDNDDLGREFHKLLTATSGIRLVDFDNFKNNTLNVVTELTCGEKDGDNFRPDITVYINGLPLAFIEVKKPNNREGILAERNRINRRFQNPKFRRFINAAQLLVFSNNMEYVEADTEPLQGVFYAAAARQNAFFNQFKEEPGARARLLGFLRDEDDAVENTVLLDNNHPQLKHAAEFKTNKQPSSPTNRALLSLFAPERFSDLLKYGFAYVEYDDESGNRRLEKHVMRYPQFFATKAIQAALERGTRKGIIWHTQGSGKTALAYFNVKWLTDYFQKKKILPKFYFIVDRLDLKNQAISEFKKRGLKINGIESKEAFVADLKKNTALTGLSGEAEITVVNIQKFSEDARATAQKDYDVNVQRVYFIDEAHRSYNPSGSFLANLADSDRNAIIISLTGTPLLGKGEVRIASREIFGGYIHKYYYDQSIRDGYTLRLIREEIENTYKLKLRKALEDLKIQEGDASLKQIYAHRNFCKPLLAYIMEDLQRCRVRHDNNHIGGMVVCHSSEQAEMLFALFNETKKETAPATVKTAILILHDTDDKQTRDDNIKRFKNGGIDLLFVFNMLLTGFDAPRLKKLYLGRVVKEHNLLQTLTRVNRPFENFRHGYVVDFADIKKEFDKTNRAYWKELQEEWGDDLTGYDNLFKSPDEIEKDIAAIKQALWQYDTANAEVFQKQISEIQDKQTLLEIRDALRLASELYNIIRLGGHTGLLRKLDFRQFARLRNEVENRIALVNLREQANEADITGVLNEALEDAIFMFRKIGEGPLDLAANNFKDLLRKTREALSGNIDKDDAEYVLLKDAIENLLRGKNWEEADEAALSDGTRILTQIYGQICELNRKDSLLRAKYDGDEKFVRVHKELSRLKITGLSEGEAKVCAALSGVKRATDTRILHSDDIITNTAFFESTIQADIMRQFVNLGIKLNPALARTIMVLIAKEYTDEREWTNTP